MPDIAMLPLAVIGLIILAGGGGWLANAARGRRDKKPDGE